MNCKLEYVRNWLVPSYQTRQSVL